MGGGSEGVKEGWTEGGRETVNRVRLQEAVGYPQLHTTYYQRSTAAPKQSNTGNGDTELREGGSKSGAKERGREGRREGVTLHKVTNGKEFGNTCDTCIMHVLGSAEGRV